MARVRVESFTTSLDGYGAGPDQSLENPLGVGGESLHEWLVSSSSWRQLHGKDGGERGIDDDFAERGTRDVGAWILPLVDARRLDPDARPGDRWEFPPLEERLPRFFEGLVATRAIPFTVLGGGVLDIEAVERCRTKAPSG